MKAEQLAAVEAERLLLQQQLDAAKTPAERNRLGQFATPAPLADEMLAYATTLLPASEAIRFLDPAFGTGVFYSALLRAFSGHRLERACAYEVDAHYGAKAAQLWNDGLLDLNLGDFTKTQPPALDNEKFNLLICNPPYVRHHHLNPVDKSRLKQQVTAQTGYQLSGLAGLYCYFLLLSRSWLTEGGVAGWLIPSELLEVNYGQVVKQFLLKEVTLLHVHRFDPQQVQFDDALVTSIVLWFRNRPPDPMHLVQFSFGGRLTAPQQTVTQAVSQLKATAKWTWRHVGNSHQQTEKTAVRVADLFTIKRGIATGANKFFILTPEQVAAWQLSAACLKPIFPSPRYLKQTEIEADEAGQPQIKRPLFLLHCNFPEAVIKREYPSVWQYLQHGVAQGINQRYLCRHRSPWYAQENRLAAPIMCTYMGRFSAAHDSPFRFILNHSAATAANVYLLLYPKPRLANNWQQLRAIWHRLQQISPHELVAEGRVYGGGLHKLEPNELANVKISMPNLVERGHALNKQLSLF